MLGPTDGLWSHLQPHIWPCIEQIQGVGPYFSVNTLRPELNDLFFCSVVWERERSFSQRDYTFVIFFVGNEKLILIFSSFHHMIFILLLTIIFCRVQYTVIHHWSLVIFCTESVQAVIWTNNDPGYLLHWIGPSCYLNQYWPKAQHIPLPNSPGHVSLHKQ